MPRTMKDKLTKKQEAFCQAMVRNNHNQTLSYMEAYPDAKPISASGNASKLMKNPLIIDRVCELEEEAWRQACITPAKILTELAQQAFSPVDNEAGLTYGVKQNAIKLLQTQLGLDVKRLEAKLEVNNININIEDDGD